MRELYTYGQRILAVLEASSVPMTSAEIGARVGRDSNRVSKIIMDCRESPLFERKRSLLHGGPYVHWVRGKDWTQTEIPLSEGAKRELLAQKRAPSGSQLRGSANAAALNVMRQRWPWKFETRYSRAPLTDIERQRLNIWANRDDDTKTA